MSSLRPFLPATGSGGGPVAASGVSVTNPGYANQQLLDNRLLAGAMLTVETAVGNLITQPSTASDNSIGEASSSNVCSANILTVTGNNNKIGYGATVATHNNSIVGAGAFDNVIEAGVSRSRISGNNANGNSISGNSAKFNSIDGDDAAGNEIVGDNANGNSISGNGANGNSISGDNIVNNSISGNGVAGNILLDCNSCHLIDCQTVEMTGKENLTLIACTAAVNELLTSVTGPATFINDVQQ